MVSTISGNSKLMNYYAKWYYIDCIPIIEHFPVSMVNEFPRGNFVE
jgi:hypothetical protein